MVSSIVVGKDCQAAVGQRVRMADEFMNKGLGVITQVHANGGYCSVRWDSGNEDGCLFTGQKGDYNLIIADGDQPDTTNITAPMSGMTSTSSVGAGDMASSAQLHKQLLAQEVVKLRREVATLRAEKGESAASGEASDALKQVRMEVARLEAQKAEVIAQANAQKALLAKEVKSLRSELERQQDSNISKSNASVLPANQSRDVAEALQRKREFEENFTRTLRDLRKELEHTSLKHLSSRGQVPLGVRSLLQLSNERVEKVMEEAAQMPVEERLHIEALRLLIENAKLRKCMNEYSEGLLQHTLVKSDDDQKKSTGIFGF